MNPALIERKHRLLSGLDVLLHSVRTRLILLLVLVVTIVYASFTFFDVKQRSAQIESEIHNQINALLDIQADTLKTPLWNFDHAEVQRQLDLLVTNRDIASALISESTVARSENVVAKSGSTPEPGKPHIEREIWYNGDKIGDLVVEADHQRLVIMRSEVIWTYIGHFLIMTSVIALTIAIAVSGLVRPILDITHAMDKIAGGDLDVTIPATERRDEIGKMAQALKVFRANAVQLKTALDKERELNGLQRQFVSMVSHEFRTPLAIIDGVAQRVVRRLDKLKPDTLKEGQQKVRQAVARLTELMESVLSAARLEEGRIAFEPSPCSLVELIAEIHGAYNQLHKDKEIILNIERLPDDVVVDGKLLGQVISNLLSNAIKYSPDGKRVWLNGHLDLQNDLVISVRDEGVGIPEAELQNLFQRFFRASTSTGIAGSGIGLNLVHHFVDLHGGRINVESEVGAGSTFTVRLPFIDPSAHAA